MYYLIDYLHIYIVIISLYQLLLWIQVIPMATGFCYVIIFLPPMGDGSFFGSDRPGWHRWAGRCVLGSWDLGWIWWKKQVAFGGFQLVISYYRSYHTLLVIFIYSIFRSSSYSSYTYIHIYIYTYISYLLFFSEFSGVDDSKLLL